MSQRNPHLYITTSDVHGQGVYTAKSIQKGEIIEICPILVLPPEELDIIHETSLHDYYFLWGKDEDRCAIALGFGSLYNHSYTPNAIYVPDFERGTLDIHCIKDIDAGEEITFNYNGEPDDKTPVWFDKGNEKKI